MSRFTILVGLFCVIALGVSSLILRAEEPKNDAKTVELFNGKDLTGWCYKTGDTVKKFDGQTDTDDKQFSAKDGVLVVNDREGKGTLWTTAEFNNDFELRFEFRASVNADSGVFIRKPQLQCRDYLLAGPYKDLKDYRPQEWNELVVMVKDKVAHCTCNGEVLEDALELPATGPIGLEGDRGQMEYRRIRLQELP